MLASLYITDSGALEAMISKQMAISLFSSEPNIIKGFFELGDGYCIGTHNHEYVQELLDSDIAYFRAAANCENLLDCQIVKMPGLESLAAGCVVQGLLPQKGVGSNGWLQSIEDKLLEMNCEHARFYQQYPDDELAHNFKRHGYRKVEEVALLHTFSNDIIAEKDNGEVSLRAVRSERDWSLKLLLHQVTSEYPDGHSSPAQTWLEMERRKCEAGYMQPFLIYYQDQVCGSVNLALSERLGRLKNLVVHPLWRRKGIGVQAARIIARQAWELGKAAAGCFAIDDAPSLTLYQSAGYLPVTKQFEWFKTLS
jgi:GNAT superfamily N-acetyltransferase